MPDKLCRVCMQWKGCELFFAHKRHPDGLQTHCKECSKAALEKMQAYRVEHRLHYVPAVKSLLNGVRSRARTLGIPFDRDWLTVKRVVGWLKSDNKCRCCGVPFARGVGSVAPNNISFDRVVPTLGYVQGNVSLLCSTCNRQKGNMTLEQFLAIVQYIVREQAQMALMQRKAG